NDLQHFSFSLSENAMRGFSRRISQSGKSPLPPSNLKNLFLYSVFYNRSLMILASSLQKGTRL
ncbi:MAG: hypothetical protein PVH64_12630, partial [Bacillota bacterium]